MRAAIKSGELAAGEQLKSVRELAHEYEVSPGTVQQAFRLLREEGLVTSWQGRGTFVRPRPPSADVEESADLDPVAVMRTLDQILDRVEHLEGQVAALEAERSPSSGSASPLDA